MNTQTSSLSEWIIVQSEGKSWLGKPQFTPNVPSMRVASREGAPIELTPIFEYALMLVPGPQGQPVMQPSLRPPFGCMSIRSLTLPGPAIWVSLDALSNDEQKLFTQLINQTEDMLRQERAKAAGLTIVPAGAKVPTSFGGGPRQ